MKNILLGFLFVPLTCDLAAQTSVYHSFPDSNATWNISSTGCCWADCGGPPTPNPIIADDWFSHYIDGDTVINSVTYHKLYKSGSQHLHCAIGSTVNSWMYYDNYHLAFREDTVQRKVFVVNPTSTVEFLLYDFSVGIGDTVSPWDPCTIVTSIDSILIGNNYRKRFNIDNSSPYFIIEGIGSTAGFMEPACPFEYSASLICFTQEGQTLYPDTLTSCSLITSVDPVPGTALNSGLVPNPFSANTALNINRTLNNADLVVMNSLGQVVAQQRGINGTSVPFDGHSLPEGIYLFQVVENGEVVAMMRGVKAR